MHNHGNFIISLGQLTPWLAQQAEALGVDVFPGFAAAAPFFDDAGAVKGVRIGDMGVQKDGSQGPNYTPGAEIHAGVTLLAEGCRGSISKELIKRFELDAGHDPQTFGLGFKELWQLPPGRVQPGPASSTASAGRSIAKTYGGSFLYHLDNDRVYVGYVVGLDYAGSALQALRGLPAVQEPSDASNRCSKAARSSPPARARSPQAAGSPCRSWRCPARC